MNASCKKVSEGGYGESSDETEAGVEILILVLRGHADGGRADSEHGYLEVLDNVPDESVAISILEFSPDFPLRKPKDSSFMYEM